MSWHGFLQPSSIQDSLEGQSWSTLHSGSIISRAKSIVQDFDKCQLINN